MKEAISTCSFCGCGCGFYLTGEKEVVNKIMPSMANAINRGSLCFKGWHIGEVYLNSNRINSPLIKEQGRFRTASFEEAFTIISDKFKALKDKEKAFGVIGSAKTTNEENYLLNRFARQVMGTNNIDSSFAIHFAPVMGNMSKLDLSLTFQDIEKADLIIIIGANLHSEAPQVAKKVLKALDKNAQLIVINSLRIPLAELAAIALQPNPDEYGALINNLSKFIGNGARASDNSADANKLREIAALYKGAKKPVVLCGEDIFKGVNGQEDFSSLANLFKNRLFPLLSLNNALGAVLFGVSPFSKSEDYEKKWQAPLPKSNGLNVIEMIKAAAAGSLKSLYVVGEDILLSRGDYAATRKALENLEFLVVQDLFLTETAKLADVVLPACSSLEKDGSYVNMEGRLQKIAAVIDPLPGCKPDWQILLELAQRWPTPLPYKDLAEISAEVVELFQLKKNFSNGDIVLAKEKRSKEFPLWIKADNSRLFYHSGSMMKNSFILMRDLEPSVAIVNFDYAKENKIQNNELVKIISRTGETTKSVLLSKEIPREIVLIRTNPLDLAYTAILPVGLKWTAGRMEKAK